MSEGKSAQNGKTLVASRLPLLAVDQLSDEQHRLHLAIVESGRELLMGQDGSLLGPFNAMLYSPRVGTALQDLGAAVRTTTSLTERAREMAILRVAAFYRSAYEWERHELLGRRAGLTDQELDALGDGGHPDTLDSFERAVLTVTDALLRQRDLSDDDWAVGVAELGHAGLVDISSLVGYYSLLALQLQIFRVSQPPSSSAHIPLRESGYSPGSAS